MVVGGSSSFNNKPLRNILLLCSFIFLAIPVAYHPRINRSVRFWCAIAPLAIEYKFLRYQQWIYTEYWMVDDTTTTDHDNDDNGGDNWPKIRIKRFHERAAPLITDQMVSLGGLVIKIGQMLSMMGGILPEAYIQSLQSLQDGMPPRDYREIRRIIENSTGRRMEDMFEEFEELPIGAASIGQAHRAVLKMPVHVVDDTGGIGDGGSDDSDRVRVIVKIRYPEVEQSFYTDFNNLELIARFLDIGHVDTIQQVRVRHEKELDFRIEAANLREVQGNMQRHGMEPSMVRIPSVRNETGICNNQVLVMEYLDGVSLKQVIDEDQDMFAKGLGQGDREELKTKLRKKLREHFDNGGGNSGGMGALANSKLMRVLGPSTAKLIRFYGGIKQKMEDATSSIQQGLGVTEPKQLTKHKGSTKKINVDRILKTIIRVHGLQLLLDGVFNLDPHPGNVLILPDGRLGLLDYGMVGRFDDEERRLAAGVISAIARQDKKMVAKIYNKAGYRVKWKEGDISDPNILYRFASFHWDRTDLSDVVVVDVKSSQKGKKDSGRHRMKERRISIVELLKTAREPYCPFWIDEARRLNAILVGITNEAMRPISLSKEWQGFAKQALNQLK